MKEKIEKLLLFETELNEKDCKRLTKELLDLFSVSSCFAYVIRFNNYDGHEIKEVFLNKEKAEIECEKLQKERKWGYYDIVEKEINNC